MTRIIQIENGIATVIENQIVATAPLHDIMQNMVQTEPLNVPLLPRTAIGFRHNKLNDGNEFITLLCELAPGIRYLVRNNKRYRLALPWTYFIFTLNRRTETSRFAMYTNTVWFARERVQRETQTVIAALLPNVDQHGGICYGGTGADPLQPFADYIDQLVNQWYLTRFNNDLVAGRTIANPWGERNWKRWVDETARLGPNAYLDWPEWTDDRIDHPPIGDKLNEQHQNQLPNRQGEEPVPPLLREAETNLVLPDILTHARAQEILDQWTPRQRTMLFQSLQTHANDEDFFLPPDPENNDPLNVDDDGGEPL